MTDLINWRKVVELEWEADRWDGDMEAHWDARAEDFARGHARRESAGLVSAIVPFVAAGPDETVLDLGCGAGTLALPFAAIARRVTAVDLSGKMLEGLRSLAGERGIRNIRTVKGRFREIAAGHLRPHDVVVSCRSLGVCCADRDNRVDLVEGLRRMHALAKSRVYLFFVTHSIALDPDFLALLDPAARGDLWRGEQSTFNLIHSLGYLPRMNYLEHPVEHAYDDPEEALAVNTRMVGLDARHRNPFLAYFKAKARRVKGDWRLPLPGRTQCIWWLKGENWNTGLA